MAGKVKTKDQIIEIEIINWDKYQPRKDIKNPNWFRLNNDWFEHPRLNDFSLEMKSCYVIILSLFSKRSKNVLETSWKRLHNVLGMKYKRIENALKQLQRNQLLTFKVRNVHVTRPSRRRALHNNTIQYNTNTC